MNTKETAKLIGVSPRTLSKWRENQRKWGTPSPLPYSEMRVGGVFLIDYSIDDIAEFMAVPPEQIKYRVDALLRTIDPGVPA